MNDKDEVSGDHATNDGDDDHLFLLKLDTFYWNTHEKIGASKIERK